jgi:chitinase
VIVIRVTLPDALPSWDYKALPISGAVVTEDSTTVSSYSYDSSKKELISYDTPNIVKTKAQYVVSQGMAGSMFWEVGRMVG